MNYNYMINWLSDYMTPTGDLVLKEKQLAALPKEISSLSSSIIQLDLRNNNITQLNSCLSSLTHLRSLDLRYNTLEFLPEGISCLVHLKILRLDNNHLTSLPIQLFSLTYLCTLTLNRNFLHAIPNCVGNLKHLSTLIISSNQLKSIPSEISSLKKLKNFYIHGNDFSIIPTSLCALQDLSEFSLEWFRYCSPPLPRILKNKIGEVIIESLKSLCYNLSTSGKSTASLVDFIEHFSDEELNINKVDLKNRTYLHIAVISGDNGVIQGLLQAGIFVNALDSDGFSAFVLALKENNSQAANLLISGGADVTIGAGCFGTPLNLAVIKSDTRLVKLLLESGISPNTQDICGNTALHGLMEVFDKHKHKSSLIADLLIAYGADPDIENSDKWTAVHVATKEKQANAIKWMFKKNLQLAVKKKEGFSFNRPGGAHGWSPLHIASHSGDYVMVETLVKVGADPSCRNFDGKTPKDTSRGNLALFKFLARMEKECYRMRKDLQDEYQAKVLNKSLSESQVCEEYKNLFLAFQFKDIDEIEDLLCDCENSVVKADAVYLLSTLRHRGCLKEIYKAKKNKEVVIKDEVRYAMNYLKDLEQVTKSMPNLKPLRTLNPVSSAANLPEYVEEETRVDTLLLYSH